MPQRIQRRRTKGWRMPEGAVYVGRPTKWGNPFIVGETAQHWHRATTHPYEFYIDHHVVGRARQAAGLFRKIIVDPSEHQFYGHKTPTIEEVRAELRGHDLACWCPLVDGDGNRVPCHADVLLELANGGDR